MYIKPDILSDPLHLPLLKGRVSPRSSPLLSFKQGD